jgi:hypothetical protein
LCHTIAARRIAYENSKHSGAARLGPDPALHPAVLTTTKIMRDAGMQRLGGVTVMLLGALVALGVPARSDAGCGCAKPAPPRAAIRPFFGSMDQHVTLFDERLGNVGQYDVLFESLDGTTDWSRGKMRSRRDLADGARRPQLRVKVPDVGLGPCRISVWRQGVKIYGLEPEQFTVIAPPVALHDFTESVSRNGFRTGVGSDGTIYFAMDVSEVSEATAFTGALLGMPLRFAASDVSFYNEQGFLMQLLYPNVPGLFAISAGDDATSDQLRYWRHEFKSYKGEHRKVDARRSDDEDADWHADGSYHVDHDHIVVAIAGTLPDGSRPAPGATPPLRFGIASTPGTLAAAAGTQAPID